MRTNNRSNSARSIAVSLVGILASVDTACRTDAPHPRVAAPAPQAAPIADARAPTTAPQAQSIADAPSAASARHADRLHLESRDDPRLGRVSTGTYTVFENRARGSGRTIDLD